MAFSKNKQVLMLVENNSFPQDIRVFQEAMALRSNGIKVSVISPTKKGQRLYERINNIEVFRYPPLVATNDFLGYFLEYGWSLVAIFLISLRILIQPGFDIIHIANPPDTLVLIAIFYKLLGKQLVYDHHDLAPELYYARFTGKGNRFVHAVLIWFEKLSCRCADHIITVNQSYKALEIQRDLIEEEKITIVRNGPLKLCTHEDPIPGLRQFGKITIVYVGVIGFQDGVDHLIRAVQHIVYTLGRVDIICVLVGEGDALSYIKSLATELKIDNYLIFTGLVDHALVARYLSTADICVAPEPSNPYNDRCIAIKMIEYMAAGKPIIAFDLPEHRVTAQGAAVYAHPNDDLDFARKITGLMDDSDLCITMGQLGKDRVEKELAWPIQEEHLLAVYNWLEEGTK
jgi:glycosyltransferase involved in cell wall biosynthesis